VLDVADTYSENIIKFVSQVCMFIYHIVKLIKFFTDCYFLLQWSVFHDPFV